MSDKLQELEISLESIQNNISEIELYLEESKQSKSHKISDKVFSLHKETTKSVKEVFQQLKQVSNFGSDLNGLRTHRHLLVEFMSVLSEFSSLQRKMIEISLVNHDCVDCGSVAQKGITNRVFGSDPKFFWISVGVAVIGGLSLVRSLK